MTVPLQDTWQPALTSAWQPGQGTDQLRSSQRLCGAIWSILPHQMMHKQAASIELPRYTIMHCLLHQPHWLSKRQQPCTVSKPAYRLRLRRPTLDVISHLDVVILIPAHRPHRLQGTDVVHLAQPCNVYALVEQAGASAPRVAVVLVGWI